MFSEVDPGNELVRLRIRSDDELLNDHSEASTSIATEVVVLTTTNY
jgi:hypothetical protein